MSGISDLVTVEELDAVATNRKIADVVNGRHRAVMHELFEERGRLREELNRAIDISPRTVAVLKMPVPLGTLNGFIDALLQAHGEDLRMVGHPKGWLAFFKPEQDKSDGVDRVDGPEAGEVALLRRCRDELRAALPVVDDAREDYRLSGGKVAPVFVAFKEQGERLRGLLALLDVVLGEPKQDKSDGVDRVDGPEAGEVGA